MFQSVLVDAADYLQVPSPLTGLEVCRVLGMWDLGEQYGFQWGN